MRKYLFYVALFLLILVFSMNVGSFDADLWARLIAGMGVIDGGHVLTQDFLSYTPTHTWYDHEWGSGVIFYLFLKYFGAYSLILLQAVMIFGIFFIITKTVELKSQKPHNIAFYIFAVMAVLPTLNNPIRCHLFSFLFFTLFLYILEKVRLGHKKILFLIPIITLFWGNIHGGVVSGIGLLLIYTLGEFLNKKSFKEYLITFFASTITLFINPWGIDYVKFLIMANSMQRPYIVEWYGIFSKFHFTKHLVFKAFILTTMTAEVILFIKNTKNSFSEIYTKTDKTKVLLLLTTLYLGIIHLKLIPFFAICATCFVYNDFYELVKDIKLPEWKDKCIYTLLFIFITLSFLTKDYSLPVGFDKYPVKEVEFIKNNKLSGNILTNFGFGSYAAYKLYPQNKIFMDGRYEEVYYDYMVPILKEFFLNTNPQLILTNFKPDIMIIEHDYPIYNALMKSDNWKEIFTGKLFSVFIKKEKDKNKKYIQPTNDMDYYKNSLFTTDINFKL